MKHAEPAVKVIQEQAPHFSAKIALILGSGLGDVVEEMTNRIPIKYKALPGFPISRVPGHDNEMNLGYLNDVPIICLKGRAHYYEGDVTAALTTMIGTLSLLGIDKLIVTNAAGSLQQTLKPGSLAAIYDHINLQRNNPLIGNFEHEQSPHFVAMQNAYDVELRHKLRKIAHDLEIPLNEGVYLAVTGPNFETPAEINAFRLLGADLVGMSTVPEVILAKHYGLKVIAISAITNYAAGMRDREESLTHEQTLLYANYAKPQLATLLKGFITEIGQK